MPPPKVASAVVHIVPAEQPEGVDPEVLERLTEAAFGQRRKMLRSSLKSMPGALEAAEGLGIDTCNVVRKRSASTNGSRWRERSALVGLRATPGALAAATVGPRLIAADSCATCGQALAPQIV